MSRAGPQLASRRLCFPDESIRAVTTNRVALLVSNEYGTGAREAWRLICSANIQGSRDATDTTIGSTVLETEPAMAASEGGAATEATQAEGGIK